MHNCWNVIRVWESSKTYTVTGMLLSFVTMSPLPWGVCPFILPHILNGGTGSHEPQQRTGEVSLLSHIGVYLPTKTMHKLRSSRSTLARCSWDAISSSHSRMIWVSSIIVLPATTRYRRRHWVQPSKGKVWKMFLEVHNNSSTIISAVGHRIWFPVPRPFAVSPSSVWWLVI